MCVGGGMLKWMCVGVPVVVWLELMVMCGTEVAGLLGPHTQPLVVHRANKFAG